MSASSTAESRHTACQTMQGAEMYTKVAPLLLQAYAMFCWLWAEDKPARCHTIASDSAT